MDFLRLHVAVNQTVYINKEIRDKIGTNLKAIPNGSSVFIFKEDLSLDAALASLESIKQDLEYMKAKNNGIH